MRRSPPPSSSTASPMAPTAGGTTDLSLRSTTDDQGTDHHPLQAADGHREGQASLGVTFNNGTVTETLSPDGAHRAEEAHGRVLPRRRRPRRGAAEPRLLPACGRRSASRRTSAADCSRTASRRDTVLATLTDDKEPGINQGMGRFDFKPKAGSKYEVQVESPLGITDHFALPAVKADGVCFLCRKA